MDKIERLTKYKKLLEENVITKEEFDLKIAEILNSDGSSLSDNAIKTDKNTNKKLKKIAKIVTISILGISFLFGGIYVGGEIVTYKNHIKIAAEYEDKLQNIMKKYDLYPYEVKYEPHDYDVYAEGFETLTKGKALECLEEIDDVMGDHTHVHPGLDVEYSYWRVSNVTVLVNKEYGGNYKKAGIYCDLIGSECIYEHGN